MSARTPAPAPAVVLTGFVGSGSIARVNGLMAGRSGQRGAAADDEPVAAGAQAASEPPLELEGGYVCCVVRGDPIRLLGALMRRSEPFDRALIATTGLADPAPVVQALLCPRERPPGRDLELAAVVAVADALHFSPELYQASESEEPIPAADVVLLNLGARRTAREQTIQDVLARPGRYHEVRQGLRAKEVSIGDGERRRRHVVCHAAAEEVRQREHRASVVRELEAELQSLAAGGGTCSRRAPALLSSSRYRRYLRETAGGKLRVDRAAVADAGRFEGKWVVASSDDTLTAEALALAHERIIGVEACWRALASSLRSWPVRELHPWPTPTHVLVSVLALLLERAMEIGVGEVWRGVADALHEIEVVDPAEAAAGDEQQVRERAATLLASSA